MAKLEDLSPDSWVVRLGYIDSSNFELYIISFYWTLTTVTTVGYGDISPISPVAKFMSIVISMTSILCLTIFVSSVLSYKDE